MLEDSRLKVFVTVVECGNFTAASRKLGISQPAVSQNVAELERILGEPLLLRTKAGVELTPGGERFLGYARQILHWYAVAERAFHPDPLSLRSDAPSPVRLHLTDDEEAEVWASEGDIHIGIIRKG